MPSVRDSSHGGMERCPPCATVVRGIAETQVEQTAADYGVDLSDPCLSGPGDSDGGGPYRADEARY
jgi:hypothetical protein